MSIDDITRLHEATDAARAAKDIAILHGVDAATLYEIIYRDYATFRDRSAATDALEAAFIQWQDERTAASWLALVAAWQELGA